MKITPMYDTFLEMGEKVGEFDLIILVKSHVFLTPDPLFIIFKLCLDHPKHDLINGRL